MGTAVAELAGALAPVLPYMAPGVGLLGAFIAWLGFRVTAAREAREQRQSDVELWQKNNDELRSTVNFLRAELEREREEHEREQARKDAVVTRLEGEIRQLRQRLGGRR